MFVLFSIALKIWNLSFEQNDRRKSFFLTGISESISILILAFTRIIIRFTTCINNLKYASTTHLKQCVWGRYFRYPTFQNKPQFKVTSTMLLRIQRVMNIESPSSYMTCYVHIKSRAYIQGVMNEIAIHFQAKISIFCLSGQLMKSSCNLGIPRSLLWRWLLWGRCEQEW